jgi:hypothetical protein
MNRAMAVIRHLYLMCCAFAVARLQAARADDRGGLSTEAAIITGVLAAGALTVMGILVAKAVSSGNNVPTYGGG